jgi:hypothetical protein
MAKTGAERQADYRARQKNDGGDKRLNIWINSSSYCSIERLSRHFNFTKKELLERLIVSAESVVLKTLAPNSPEWHDYMQPKS